MYTDSPVIYNVYSSGIGFICSAEEKTSNTLEYCAHDVTQSMSLLLRLKIIQNCVVNKIFPSQNWCWVKKNCCALKCVIDFMSSSVEDDGMSYVNICILHLRNCTTGVILFSSDVAAFLFFSHSCPVNHSFVSPWCSGWQTKTSVCPVFLVSHRVLPELPLSY